jgi:formamidopyrimidine-DNA glycosylase
VPELPDLTVYVEALRARVAGTRLRTITLGNPFLLRTVDPPLEAAHGRTVEQVGLLGKRIVLSFSGGLHLVVHLMIAGRLHWKDSPAGGVQPTAGSSRDHAAAPRPKAAGRRGLAAFEFERGILTLTEAGSKRRASLHVVAGPAGLQALDRGGIDPLAARPDEFCQALVRENHTVKRALTDPRLFSGIGNAYSDEILHAARLSPMQLTRNLDDEEVARLRRATVETLLGWLGRLRAEAGDRFPEKVTAFRAEMAVHGRFRQPCPACGSPVQRIVYADNEANYCARCQTGGRLLADRALSRLLRDDWPKRLEDVGD